jgi:hypothetical protein
MGYTRLFGSVFFLWLNFAAALGAQTNRPTQPLVLTVEIMTQQYCTINSDLSSLRMRLKLRYTNVGKQKVILYKGHDLFYQTRIRSLSTGAVEPYEVTFLNSRYFDEEPEPIDRPSPGKVFVILAPGATYEREVLSDVGVAARVARRGNSVIADGEHTLQLTVSTWYKSKALAQKLGQQWERKGLLWFEPVTSMPLRFTVLRSNTLAPCK